VIKAGSIGGRIYFLGRFSFLLMHAEYEHGHYSVAGHSVSLSLAFRQRWVGIISGVFGQMTQRDLIHVMNYYHVQVLFQAYT
jgi:hypothetical protein